MSEVLSFASFIRKLQNLWSFGHLKLAVEPQVGLHCSIWTLPYFHGNSGFL